MMKMFGVAVVTLASVACGGGESQPVMTGEVGPVGPKMRPGDNCLRCHSIPGKFGAPPWSVGGTVYPTKDSPETAGVAGVKVIVTDAKGVVANTVTNEVGNFWIAQPLERPYRVAIEREGRRKEMPIEAPAGSCNACHSWPDPAGDAPGRIFAP